MRKKMETAAQNYCHAVDGERREIDREEFLLKSKNRSDLLKIQEIMSIMERRTYTLDQVLERVIGFYGKHVPLN